MTNSVLIIATMSIVTILLRFLPFWVFGENHKTPEIIAYLGTVLPYAIMGMLVVYCLKDTNFLTSPFGIPEIIGCTVTVLLHIWKRNPLISICAGTLFYMFLLRLWQ